MFDFPYLDYIHNFPRCFKNLKISRIKWWWCTIKTISRGISTSIRKNERINNL